MRGGSEATRKQGPRAGEVVGGVGPERVGGTRRGLPVPRHHSAAGGAWGRRAGRAKALRCHRARVGGERRSEPQQRTPPATSHETVTENHFFVGVLGNTYVHVSWAHNGRPSAASHAPACAATRKPPSDLYHCTSRAHTVPRATDPIGPPHRRLRPARRPPRLPTPLLSALRFYCSISPLAWSPHRATQASTAPKRAAASSGSICPFLSAVRAAASSAHT